MCYISIYWIYLILTYVMSVYLLQSSSLILRLSHLWLVEARLAPYSFWHNRSVLCQLPCVLVLQDVPHSAKALLRHFGEALCSVLNFRVYFLKLLFYKIFNCLKESLQWLYDVNFFFFGNKEYLKKDGIRKESKWFITALVWNATSSLRFVPPTAALQPSSGSRNIWIKTGSFLGIWQSSTFVTLYLHEARYCWFGLCDMFEPWFLVVPLGPCEVSRALAAYFSCLFGSSL